MGKMVIESKNALQTKQLGKQYADKTKNGGVILLFGDLGSGKTTFTQGFAKALGIKKHIISPTFLLMRSYEIPGNDSGKFYHLDLYRLGSGEEVRELGIDEILQNPRNIMVIEWADKLGNILPSKRTELHFEYMEEDIRKIMEKSYEKN